MIITTYFSMSYWDAVRHFYAVRRAQSIRSMSPGIDMQETFLYLVYYIFNMFLKALPLVFVSYTINISEKSVVNSSYS